MQPSVPFMLMLQLYLYSGQTQCQLERLSFQFSSLRWPMGEVLNQGMVFVKDQRELSAGYGVQGALWETWYTSVQALAFFWCPWNAIPTTQPLLVACNLPAAACMIQWRTQCKAAWYLAFLRHVTFFLMLSRGIYLRTALPITFWSLAPSFF